MKKRLICTLLIAWALVSTIQANDTTNVATNLQKRGANGKYSKEPTLKDFENIIEHSKVPLCLKDHTQVPFAQAEELYSDVDNGISVEMKIFLASRLEILRENGCDSIWNEEITIKNFDKVWAKNKHCFVAGKVKFLSPVVSSCTASQFDAQGNYLGVDWEDGVTFKGVYDMIIFQYGGQNYLIALKQCDNIVSKDIMFAIQNGAAELVRVTEKFNAPSETSSSNDDDVKAYDLNNETVVHKTVIDSTIYVGNAPSPQQAPATTPAVNVNVTNTNQDPRDWIYGVPGIDASGRVYANGDGYPSANGLGAYGNNFDMYQGSGQYAGMIIAIDPMFGTGYGASIGGSWQSLGYPNTQGMQKCGSYGGYNKTTNTFNNYTSYNNNQNGHGGNGGGHGGGNGGGNGSKEGPGTNGSTTNGNGNGNNNNGNGGGGISGNSVGGNGNNTANNNTNSSNNNSSNSGGPQEKMLNKSNSANSAKTAQATSAPKAPTTAAASKTTNASASSNNGWKNVPPASWKSNSTTASASTAKTSSLQSADQSSPKAQATSSAKSSTAKPSAKPSARPSARPSVQSSQKAASNSNQVRGSNAQTRSNANGSQNRSVQNSQRSASQTRSASNANRSASTMSRSAAPQRAAAQTRSYGGASRSYSAGSSRGFSGGGARSGGGHSGGGRR